MRELALFPLNVFLLPGDYTQLYIFEERYKQLVRQCLATKTEFGIPFSNKLNGKNYGSLAQIVEVVKEYPQGEMDIVIKGTGLFKLEQFFYQIDNKLYPGGRITDLELPTTATASNKLETGFRQYLVKHEIYNSDLLEQPTIGLFEIANAIKMSDVERLDLVSLGSAKAIDAFLINYLHYLELLHQQEDKVFENIYLN